MILYLEKKMIFLSKLYGIGNLDRFWNIILIFLFWKLGKMKNTFQFIELVIINITIFK